MDDQRVVPERSDATASPWVIVIAASAGGFQGLLTILSTLPGEMPAAILVVLHRPPRAENGLVQIFSRYTRMPVQMAVDGQPVEANVVYIARSDQHLRLTLGGRFMYVDGARIRHLRSSANPLLESAAAAFGDRVIAVVLSGTGQDGTDGVRKVKAHGGIVIAQDCASSEHWDMPEAAVKSGAVDYVLPLVDIGSALDAVVHGRDIGRGSAAGSAT
jgi:two-component system, chemotaxis family, protein-glutamate methylesterase/glutaminase